MWAWLGYEGRVSTSIQERLPAEREVITDSGLRYRIDSPVGTHPDAEYVWEFWCAAQGFDPLNYVNISTDYVIG